MSTLMTDFSQNELRNMQKVWAMFAAAAFFNNISLLSCIFHLLFHSSPFPPSLYLMFASVPALYFHISSPLSPAVFLSSHHLPYLYLSFSLLCLQPFLFILPSLFCPFLTSLLHSCTHSLSFASSPHFSLLSHISPCSYLTKH